jgi:hypothetical protein
MSINNLFSFRKSFLKKAAIFFLLMLPISLGTRRYLMTHRIIIYLNLFVVRDVDGNLIRHQFEFYIKKQEQHCEPGYYW